jgi:hypothetical protein
LLGPKIPSGPNLTEYDRGGPMRSARLG